MEGEKLIENIKTRLEKVINETDPEFIVLTKAIEGEERGEKDYYMIIVSENIPTDPKERIEMIKKELGELSEQIDIYPYKLLEFKNLLSKKQPYVIRAIDEGKAIYDKGTFQKIRDAIHQGLKRIVINEETIWDLR